LSRAQAREPFGQRDERYTAVLFVASLLPRLYVAIAWPREPVWDGHYYDFGARRIAAGLGYSDGVMGQWHPWCHWPVGFSGALASVYWVFGATPRAATVFNAVVGALLAVATHRLAGHGLSRARARVAGALVGAFPGLIVYSALVMSEPLSALLLVMAGWAWVRERERHPRRGAAIAGLLLGLGTLVHPSFVAYAPALLALEWLLLLRQAAWWPALREASVRAAIATACVLVPVLPWTARNCRVMDRCTLVSSNGGWNLAIGAFERATGRFETLRSSDGCRVVTGQVQQDACWRDLGLAAIRRDPARWLALIPEKLGYTFDHESFPIEYLHEADPDRWPEPRRARAREWLTTLHRLLLCAAALGVVTRPTLPRLTGHLGRWRALAPCAVMPLVCLTPWVLDNHPFWIVPVATAVCGAFTSRGSPVLGYALLCLVGTMATHAVFFGEDRYHVVVTPLLCLLTAAAFRAHEPTSPAPQRTSVSS